MWIPSVIPNCDIKADPWISFNCLSFMTWGWPRRALSQPFLVMKLFVIFPEKYYCISRLNMYSEVLKNFKILTIILSWCFNESDLYILLTVGLVLILHIQSSIFFKYMHFPEWLFPLLEYYFNMWCICSCLWNTCLNEEKKCCILLCSIY